MQPNRPMKPERRAEIAACGDALPKDIDVRFAQHRKELEAEVDRLVAENAEITMINADLEAQNTEQKEDMASACAEAEIVGYYGMELDAAVVCFRNRIAELATDIESIRYALGRADAENAELRKDAARLDWLAETCNGLDTAQKYRAGIDAAMVRRKDWAARRDAATQAGSKGE